MRAQGSLEYLIILAAVLGVSAIVVLFITGTFTGTTKGADISKCRLAAEKCKLSKMSSPADPCLSCDTACTDSAGKDLLDGRLGCGLACSECKKGNAIHQGSGSTLGLVADFKFDEGNGVATASGAGQIGTLLPGAGNLMTNPGFESGVWTLGDCHNDLCSVFPGAVCTPRTTQQSCVITGGTCILSLTTSTDKVEGLNSLNITGVHSGSCGYKEFSSWTIGKQYSISFWYKHSAGVSSPWYCIWSTGTNNCNPEEKLTTPAQKDGNWHQYIKSFVVQAGTTSQNLHFYAITDSSFTQSTELYDNVQISEGPIWTSGKSGNAIYFDGGDDFVNVPDSDLFSPSSFTINAWIKWDGIRYSSAASKDFAAIVSKGSFDNGEYTILMNRNSASTTTTLNFYIAGSVRAAWTNSQVDTNWHMLTFTYNGTNAKIYFDGAQKITTPATLTVPNTANTFKIGTQTSGNYQWGGSIDEVEFFSRALSDQEITQLFF